MLVTYHIFHMLQVRGRDVGFQTTKEGEFWRILLPGIYTMEVFAEGFAPREVQFAIVEQNPTMLNVTLYPVRFYIYKTKQCVFLSFWSDPFWLQDTPRRDGNPDNEPAASTGIFSFNPLSGIQEGVSGFLSKLPIIG